MAPPIRFVAAQTADRFSFDDLRYSTSVELAIANHRSMLGLNDGGVLPRSTELLFHAVAMNTQPALLASACNYEYVPQENSWKKIIDAMPRCRFIPADRIHLADKPLRELSLHDFQNHEESKNSKVRILQETPQSIEVECESSLAGMVVLSDIVYPGWACAVDGVDVRIRSVHGVFRGVDVGTGAHRIRFAYDPQSFRFGCFGTALGIVLVTMISLIEIARKRTERRRSVDNRMHKS